MKKDLLLYALAKALPCCPKTPMSALERVHDADVWESLVESAKNGFLTAGRVVELIEALNNVHNYLVKDVWQKDMWLKANGAEFCAQWNVVSAASPKPSSFDYHLLASNLMYLLDRYHAAVAQGVRTERGIVPFFGDGPRIRHIVLQALILDQDIEDADVAQCLELLSDLATLDEYGMRHTPPEEPALTESAIKDWISYIQSLDNRGLQGGGFFPHQTFSIHIVYDGIVEVRSLVREFGKGSCPQQAFVDELKKLVQRFDEACLPLEGA